MVVPGITDGAQQTLLYDFSVEPDLDKNDELLDLLGLDSSSLRYEPNSEAGNDYRLILGADYDPCFNPVRIER